MLAGNVDLKDWYKPNIDKKPKLQNKIKEIVQVFCTKKEEAFKKKKT